MRFPLLTLAACAGLTGCGEPEECDSPLCPEDTGCAECPDCPEDSDPPVDTAETGDSGEPPPPPPLTIALYDDSAEAEPGAWAPGLDAIEAAITGAGHSVERIDRRDLNDDPGRLHDFDALLFGGGYAYPGYTVHVSDRGKARIQEFIQRGGAYIGICAGAYFACDSLDYEGYTWGDESGYDTDLYPSVCGGPVHEVSTYPHWAPATVDFPGHEAYAEFEEGEFQRQLYYAGGPFFPEPLPHIEVLATYADEGPHQGEPAAVTLPYGRGRVVLWGPHPEVLESEDLPHVVLDHANRELYATIVAWAARKHEEHRD